MRKLLDKGVEFFLAILLSGMTFVVFLQVFYRYALRNPLSWPEEVARILIVWLAFIGGYLAMRRNKQVGFDLFVKKFPVRVGAVVKIVAKVLTALFLVVMIREGIGFAKIFLTVPMPYTGLATGRFVYSALPISGALMLLQTMIEISEQIKVFKNLPKEKAIEGVTNS